MNRNEISLLHMSKRMLALLVVAMFIPMVGCAMAGSSRPPVFPAYRPPVSNYPSNLPPQNGVGAVGAQDGERNSFFTGFQSNYAKSKFGSSGSC